MALNLCPISTACVFAPQVPLMITLLTTEIVAENIEAIVECDTARNKFSQGLTDLNDRAYHVDQLHERFLQEPSE
jgi:hypothetical protein